MPIMDVAAEWHTNCDCNDANICQAMRSLPHHTLAHSYRPTYGSWQDLECPVCLEKYIEGSVVVVSPCGHVMHKGCTVGILRESQRRICPYCRSPLLPESLEALLRIDNGAVLSARFPESFERAQPHHNYGPTAYSAGWGGVFSSRQHTDEPPIRREHTYEWRVRVTDGHENVYDFPGQTYVHPIPLSRDLEQTI